MKLAFCLYKYFPFGGLQRDFVRIARECLNRGHEVHVFTMSWQGETMPGFHLHVLPVKGWQNHTRACHFVEQVQAIIAKEQFDRVIGFNKMPGLDIYYAADVCFEARVREKHGFWYRLLPRYRHLHAYERAVFDKDAATQILLIAAKQQPEFQHYYQTPVERFHLLPPGIVKHGVSNSEAATLRAQLREEFQLTNRYVVLMVGSGFKTKGVDRAIAAMAALPAALREKTVLLVIGQDRADSFQALAEKLKVKDNVIFLGGRSDVPRFLFSADVFIHPAYHENTGTVLLEAMTAGLPVLTTNVCGYATYIQQADAGVVLTPPFEQTKLNEALAMMITSPMQTCWKENGKRFAQDHDLYSMPQHAADICLREKIPQTKRETSIAGVTEVRNFDFYMSLRGEIFRQLEGRLTQRVVIDNTSYFIKQHHGIGWKEILKNLLQLRLPVLGAKNEYLAIKKLQRLQIGVPNVIAYAAKGCNPAKQKSFILLEDLTPSISLEDICKPWRQMPPAFAFKQSLLRKVAAIARILHTNGLNHRDFYLCHFLLNTTSTEPELCLIDLHRAQIRAAVPTRWIIKDLAGLYFSSKEIGLTKRDLYRFMCEYHRLPLKHILGKHGHFWNQVKAKGERLYHDHAH